MTRVLAIARREIGAFFHSPMAAVVLAGFLVAVGLFFTIFLLGYSEMSQNALQSPAADSPINLAEGIFRPLVSNTVFFLLFLVPAITMRLFAPEFSSGRYHLIASWPVSDRTWVLGKWLGAMACGGIMVLCGGAYIASVWLLGTPEVGPALTALLGELLFVAALTAWGLLASALFAHQMVAYFLGFSFSLFLFLVGALERFLPGAAGVMAHDLSLLTHFELLSRGVLDARDIVYFLLMTAVPLTIAVGALHSRRLPPRRRFVVWGPAATSIVLAVAVYTLAGLYPWSLDTTGNGRYSLAPQSLQVLQALPDDLAALPDSVDVDHLMVYAFYQRLDPVRDITEALLKSCSHATPAFRFQVVDPETDLDLVRRFDVKVDRTIVISAGERSASVLQPQESTLINAVYRLVSGKRTKIDFLMGHGEHRFDSGERSGYSVCGGIMGAQGYQLSPLFLGENPVVPPDCDVVLVAGPRTEPDPRELAALDDHLLRGGSILALFDPPTPSRWAEWMAGKRVGLTGGVMVSADRADEEYGVSARTIVVGDGYGDHVVSRPLRGVATVFPLIQPLAEIGRPDSTIAGAVLLLSSDLTWAETDPATMFSGKPTFDRGHDVPGPLPLAMALEISPDATRAVKGRMVVVGNSEFISNANINLGANRDLLLNALAWLAQEKALIQLRGRDPLNQPVVLGREGRRLATWGSSLGWPFFVGSLAVVIMLRHRRRSEQHPGTEG